MLTEKKQQHRIQKKYLSKIFSPYLVADIPVCFCTKNSSKSCFFKAVLRKRVFFSKVYFVNEKILLFEVGLAWVSWNLAALEKG